MLEGIRSAENEQGITQRKPTRIRALCGSRSMQSRKVYREAVTKSMNGR